MKLPESTEWVLHAVTALAQLGPGSTASAAQLAAHHDVPAAYLAKQLQSLVRAGVLNATTGPRGGFRLARRAEEITLLQVVEAVDGGSPFYTCSEIRQRGSGAVPPEQCRRACALAARMAEAEAAWRQSLAAVTIASIVASLPPGVPERTRTLLSRPHRRPAHVAHFGKYPPASGGSAADPGLTCVLTSGKPAPTAHDNARG